MHHVASATLASFPLTFVAASDGRRSKTSFSPAETSASAHPDGGTSASVFSTPKSPVRLSRSITTSSPDGVKVISESPTQAAFTVGGASSQAMDSQLPAPPFAIGSKIQMRVRVGSPCECTPPSSSSRCSQPALV